MSRLDFKCITRNLHIDSECVPLEYCWSGYTSSTKEFEEKNFCCTTVEGHNLLVCSAENAMALCDYVSNKILKLECVWDTENIYSPGYDIWFYYAWEKTVSTLDESPQWMQDIIKYLIDVGIILQYNVDEQEYFIFADSEECFDNNFPAECTEQIEMICRKGVIEFWDECLKEADGNIEELIEPECGVWGQKQFELFVENPEYEIMACCTSEDGHSIAAGTSITYRECFLQDDYWIYTGMSEAIYENWCEFEDVVAQVELQGIEYFESKNILPETEAEVKQFVYKCLNKSLGDFTIAYEVDGVEIQLDYVFAGSEAIYDLIIENFAIDHRILHELRTRRVSGYEKKETSEKV